VGTFDPVSIMRTLMPTLQARVDTGNQRRDQYGALARRQEELNLETNPALMSDFDRNQAKYNMDSMVVPGSDPAKNKEYWSNNAKLQALGSLRQGGVGNYARGPSFTPAGGGITDAGEVDRSSALQQPGNTFAQAMAALRKAAGMGG
jgi:hypothetical protein